MSATLKYECPSCNDVHEDKYEAQTCCNPEEVYVCNACGTKYDYDEEDKAEGCCAATARGRHAGAKKLYV